MAEKIGTMLLQMAVSLIILRLLTRDILGVMAIPTAVVAVALVLVDSGFSQALIRKAAPSADDYKSVFAFNIGVSLVMYALFTVLAGSLAGLAGAPFLRLIPKYRKRRTLRFGPFLAFGMLIWIFFGDVLVRMYMRILN